MSLSKRDQFCRKWQCKRCAARILTYHYPGDVIRPPAICSVCMCREVERAQRDRRRRELECEGTA